MPAIDHCQPAVIRAFQKQDWEPTHYPFPIRVNSQETVYADLRLRNTKNQQTAIIVEVKCFPHRRSALDEFYHTLGQYIMYRKALELKQFQTPLYLVVPLRVFQTFFKRQTVKQVIEEIKVNIIVVDIDQEVIVEWIP